ncbi:MAG: GNAT family N-acetyltransferase [Asgard group archaeon]|nr:GNAT family N-acetyltransferase [Asgard group archaeon]
MNSANSEYLIEQFTIEKGKFDELAKLITQAFTNDPGALEEGASVAFTEDTFNMMYGAPSVDKDLFVRAIHKPTGKIVGFLGAIPRTVKIKNKTYKLGIPSWLCVHSQHQKKGIAKAMGMKLFEIGQKTDYDGAFSFHEPQQHGVDVSTSVAKELNIPMKTITTLKQFVIKAFDVDTVSTAVRLRWYEKLVFKLFQKYKRINSKYIRKFQEKDIPEIFEIIKETVDRNELAIVPELDDLKWMLKNPAVNCVVHEDENGKVNGFILAWEFILAGMGNQIPYGWLDMVHIHRLSIKEAGDLANYLCQTCDERGWYGLQTPYIPYFSMKPLKKARFFFFGKIIHMDLFNYKNLKIPDKLESFYFDWR